MMRSTLLATKVHKKFMSGVPIALDESLLCRMNPSRFPTTDIRSLSKALGALMRTAVVSAAICLTVVSLTSAAEVVAAMRKPIEIPAQDLGPALKAFAAVREMRMVYLSDDVRNVHTRGISGDMTSHEALQALLAGTGLTYRFLDDKTVSVFPADFSRAATNLSWSEKGASGEDSRQARDPGVRQDSLWSRFRVAQIDQRASLASDATPGSPSSSAAQPAKLEEIVVTAQKKTERLQDVPVPVSVVNADTLASNGQALIRDYYTTVPGLNVTPGGSDRQPLSIRGITTGGYTTPTVGVMIDDVPFGGSTTSGGIQIPDIDPGDLARVEVLRGPQGTLYGSNSMGGLVKFVTKDPTTDSFSGRVEVGTSDVYNGAEPGFNFRASANVPISETLAVRMSGFRRQDPGYIDNPVTGENGVNEAEAAGVRLAALWRPTGKFSAKLAALYQNTKTNGSSEVDVAPNLPGLSQNYVRGAANGGNARTQLYSLTLSYRSGSVDLTSITGYNEDRFSYSVDFSCCDGSTVSQVYNDPAITGAPLTGYYDVKKFTQEFRLSGRATSRLDWLLGAFYTHESVPNVVNELAENPATGQIVGPFFANSDPVKFEEYAVFADLTFHFTDRFDLQIGGRESHTRNIFEETIQTGPAIEPFYGHSSPYVTPAAEATANTFTYLLTPSFKVAPDFLLYARVASGYRPGIANTGLQMTASVPRESNPDMTRNYEVGAKVDFLQHRLSLDTSVYYID